jgi:hypothetical protein
VTVTAGSEIPPLDVCASLCGEQQTADMVVEKKNRRPYQRFNVVPPRGNCRRRYMKLVKLD